MLAPAVKPIAVDPEPNTVYFTVKGIVPEERNICLYCHDGRELVSEFNVGCDHVVEVPLNSKVHVELSGEFETEIRKLDCEFRYDA